MKKDTKTEFVIIRVTKQEKENFRKKSGKNLSVYIRKLLGLDK